ncbi:hypothetical protein DCC85_02070 [Paenibacillus sp. CAA11]|uniref:hypothetical protein n=1 Tax=Paenibacillus sp. CAA11 TaxID=1532905 RepID=UPI000D33C098|nr:hypothetical protein [Paenibacillus sp. CAA11]AWB43136.1 hypothetical protein DCC85_02070 [Paenibacillus sp. CAA11]
MTFLAKLSAMVAIIYLIKVFIYPIYKPVMGKQKKRNRRYLQERKRSQFKEKVTRWKKDLAVQFGGRLLGNVQRMRLQKIINRLDLTIQPEEIRINQVLYMLAALLVTMVLMSANRLLGCVAGIFIIIAWIYPVKELEEKIEKKNKNIALGFPGFYSMVYYQYSKSVNIYLSDVIKDYIPNANPDLAEELGVMLDNIEYGEDYALKQLKKRVPVHYIIKFCDLMETRLKGYDNISQMVYLKNEVDSFRLRALEDELAKRERSNSKLQLVLIFVLGVYIVIYYLFTMLDAMEMFQ